MISVLLNPLTILLATLCLQWVAFASTGLLSLQLPYFALALVAFYAASGPRKIAAAAHFATDNVGWITPLAACLMLTGVVLYGSPIETMVPRQLFFLIGVLAFGACVAVAPRLPQVLRVGGILGIAVFVLAVELLARRIGLSWTDAAERFTAGDFNFVIFAFFRGVFNALDSTGDVLLVAATKNMVAVSLLVIAMLVRSGSNRPSRDILGIGLLGVTLALLLMLNTRSVLLAAVPILVMATVVGAAIRPARNLVPLVLKAIGLLGLLVACVALYLPELGISNSLSERFAFDDYSVTARVDQFQLAFAQIEMHPFTGRGYYEANGHIIHNLFLAAWVHAGVVAFALAVIFYIVLIVRWLRIVAAVVAQPERWVLPIAFEWIAPLPILPIFRVWLSGDAGNLFLGEWIAVSAFFGCVLANKLRHRRLAGLQGAAADPASQLQTAFAATNAGSHFEPAFESGTFARSSDAPRSKPSPRSHRGQGTPRMGE
jgi:O-antigen ligase